MKRGLSEEKPGVATVFCKLTFTILKTMAETCYFYLQSCIRSNGETLCITKESENPRDKLPEKTQDCSRYF